MNLTLVYPMFAMVMVTFIVALSMLAARIQGIRSGKMQMRYFRTFTDGDPTEQVTKTARHYTNLFELPVLFYAGCIVGLLLPIPGYWLHVWAWTFVAARIVHAYIHIGPNRIRPRMLSFFVGWFAVLALWMTVVIELASK